MKMSRKVPFGTTKGKWRCADQLMIHENQIVLIQTEVRSKPDKVQTKKQFLRLQFYCLSFNRRTALSDEENEAELSSVTILK